MNYVSPNSYIVEVHVLSDNIVNCISTAEGAKAVFAITNIHTLPYQIIQTEDCILSVCNIC